MKPPAWLHAALDYLPQWLSHQMLITEQPGCAVAVAWQGKTVFEAAFGHADAKRNKKLTPRHRFRVASHSKTFTTVGVMRLRELGRWRLDDPVGRYVKDLHADVAQVTLAQLASHSAGLVRDGADAGQWALRQPFLSREALRTDVARGLTLDAGTRFKYSNHGYGLLGLAIEAVAGEPFNDWIAREVVARAGLQETVPDAQHLPARGAPLAQGHSAKHPVGQRVALPAAMSTHALAAATGFVSTAGDLAKFYGSLSPQAKHSVLSPASRRDMARRLWASEHDSTGRWYGLGTISGSVKGSAGEWQHFGHSGGFPGQITRTACVPAQGLAVSVLTNAADGLSHPWLEGALQVLQAFAHHGAPAGKKLKDWQGRYWNLWGAFDLLPVGGDRVLVANPGLMNPVLDASHIELQRKDQGRIVLAGGFAFHGEPARLERDASGAVKALWLGGMRLTHPSDVARSLKKIRA
jgi:D-alanyl-D-alanine carboxypeptidase